MNLERKTHKKLLAWKTRKNRKPLILRGARQVGKTTLIKMFANEFAHSVFLNLEKDEDRAIFEKNNSLPDILNAIFLQKKIAASSNEILIFIDEIQESPKAISMLRYFFEDHPELYVIAAGSLLEFAMDKVASFPVGRVEYLCLHPFDFEEFLLAIGHLSALAELNKFPVAGYAHETLLSLVHEYTLIGGMPEVVSQYVQDKNLGALPPLYENLWQTYKDDVEKYSRNDTERKIIRHVMEAAPKEPDRIKFENFGQSNYKSREVGEAMRALDMAKVIQLIYPSTNVEPPIQTDLRKRPRLQLLDTGLLNHASGLQAELLGVKDLNDFYRGKVIQHLVIQQIIALHAEPSFKPHFWVREKKNSNSEVDLIMHCGKYIIPVEIKSGEKGRLRSLHQFIEECGHPYAVRLWAGKFSIEEATTPAGTPYLLMNLPYYLAIKLPEYLEWFVGNHKI